jgi:hypothetical protein
LRQGECDPVSDLVEDGQEIGTEALGVLAHREVPELPHDRETRPRDAGGRRARVLGRAGEVVLAGQEVEGAARRVDPRDAVAQITLDTIEVEVPAEDAGAALRVHPERLPSGLVGGLGRDQTRHERARHLAAVDVRAVEPRGVVVPRGLVGGGLEPDQRAEALRRPPGELQHDLAPDRAAEDDRALESKGLGERQDQGHVGVRRQPVLLVLPAGGREGLPVARHVEREHPPVARDGRIRHEVPELPAVRAGGVETHERPALAGLLEVEAVELPAEREAEIASQDRLELGHRGISPDSAGVGAGPARPSRSGGAP